MSTKQRLVQRLKRVSLHKRTARKQDIHVSLAREQVMNIQSCNVVDVRLALSGNCRQARMVVRATDQLGDPGLVILISAAANELQAGCKDGLRPRRPGFCSLLLCQSKGAQLLGMVLLRPELGQGDQVQGLELPVQRQS